MTPTRTFSDETNPLDDHYAFDHYSLRHIIGSPLEEMTYIPHRHPHLTHDR